MKSDALTFSRLIFLREGILEFYSDIAESGSEWDRVTSICIRNGIFEKAAVDASPCERIVVPPFAKKPFAASWTFEGLEVDASDGVERHPTSRCYKRWSCRLESPHG